MGISHSLRSRLEEADKYEAVVPSSKSSPKVSMNSYVLDGTYSYDLVDLSKNGFGKIGIEIGYYADIYGSYAWPAFWLYR